MSVELGTVIAPSGALLIVDPGYLRMWTHDGPPVLPEGILSSPEATANANRAVDLEIVGRDAEQVGRKLDRQWHPRFVFDYPRHAVDELAKRIAAIAAPDRLDARLEILPERVTHRRRIDLALEHGRGAGEIIFHGIWAGVVRDVPPGPVRVLAELMPPGGPDEGRLRRVVIAAREAAVARSERFAYVGVDWGRLMVVDVDDVREWKDGESLDGKADFAFWGHDAETVAGRVGADVIGDGVYGWRDLPAEQAAARGARVLELKEQAALKLATDFRPHTHHYQLMEQVRSSQTDSGTVTLGGARACGFATRWGDGIFEVYRDLDADGRLVRIRIELGTEERQKLMRRLELQWTADGG